MVYQDGSEAVLWGVNLQPSLSWEYRRMANHGLHEPFEMDAYKAMIDEAYDELELMGCNLIRIHLSPGDFTDTEGNLVENQWLELTDYVLAEAEKRGMYTYLAFLNTLGAARGKDTFISTKDDTKPIWMIDPVFMAKADRFIRQLLNRQNRFSGGAKYKSSPALAIVEPINEPGYFTREEIEAYPNCLAVYLDWLKANGKADSVEGFTTWRADNSKRYINRMVQFFRDEGVAAPMSWSMEWPRMMEWTGEDVFEAAAESDAEIVSVCFYPGQAAAYQKRGEDLKAIGEQNYFGYIQQSYDEQPWHGWMRDERFRKKARIVYEFETYYNQTSYLYPLMAKYFRAQGIQAAAMWTYILPGQAEYTAAAHNLNLKTTPNKTAAFIAAGEVMKSQPRYELFSTTSETEDYFSNTALSYELGCSAFGTGRQLIHSESLPQEFIDHLPPLSEEFDRMVGRGDSPYVKYGGSGLYFIESQSGKGVTIKILPDAEFVLPRYLPNGRGEKTVELTVEKSHSFELNLPGFGNDCKVYRKVDGQWKRITSIGARFEALPGEYLIKK
ncbi:hypothetical protein PDESU_01584 [Pontiella desulfatans]|uniref:Glycoside hydrolase family 5 domain-containing protein n=1 Tax=Pontiella desulfatans TaxID=2750659 RepID=A0A6C2TZB0_PONDE|nr:hypothetical protein [Pontiella desulfatans]VGO13030.1 hypothetical protein PDESU_01584 [Pontiella desulfatans]